MNRPIRRGGPARFITTHSSLPDWAFSFYPISVLGGIRRGLCETDIWEILAVVLFLRKTGFSLKYRRSGKFGICSPFWYVEATPISASSTTKPFLLI
jgi:hypothetical protein